MLLFFKQRQQNQQQHSKLVWGREREIVNVQGREERRRKRRNELGRDAWK